jgi:hypothetical protein
VTARLALLLVAAAALAGCGGGGTGSTSGRSSEPLTIRIDVEDGKPVGGIKRATAAKDQQVELVVHSDVADEVHVHGYDLHEDVETGGTARIRFTARLTGVFEAELESRKLQIVELTVR